MDVPAGGSAPLREAARRPSQDPLTFRSFERAE